MKFEIDFEKIDASINTIKQDIEDFKLYNELYSIKNQQYNNHKINLETWLKFKQSYNRAHATINTKINNLKLNTNYLQKKIKSPNPLLELHILNALKANFKTL